MSHIYFVYTESGAVKEIGGLTENVRCKIGITTSPKVRLDQLQTGLHEPLTAHVWKINSPEIIEKSLHTLFRKNRLHGEWFSIPRRDFESVCWIIDTVGLTCYCAPCQGFYTLERAVKISAQNKVNEMVQG